MSNWTEDGRLSDERAKELSELLDTELGDAKMVALLVVSPTGELSLLGGAGENDDTTLLQAALAYSWQTVSDGTTPVSSWASKEGT